MYVSLIYCISFSINYMCSNKYKRETLYATVRVQQIQWHDVEYMRVCMSMRLHYIASCISLLHKIYMLYEFFLILMPWSEFCKWKFVTHFFFFFVCMSLTFIHSSFLLFVVENFSLSRLHCRSNCCITATFSSIYIECRSHTHKYNEMKCDVMKWREKNITTSI